MKEEPIVKLNGTEFSPVEGETLRTQVLSFFMSQGGSANTPFGNVLLDKRGVKNDLSHPNYLNKTHAFAAVKDVLEKGKVTTPFDYHDVHGKKQPTGIITGYIVIGEQPFKMDVTVIGNADGEMRLYCHDVYQIPITENHQKSIITKNILGASSLYPSCNSLGEYANLNKNNKNMKKKVIKLNENTLKQIVAESIKKVLKEDVYTAQTFKKLEKVLSHVAKILSDFSNSIPSEQSQEFMRLIGREWNDLWHSLSSIEETTIRINNPRGLSQGDLNFDDLS